ncbi:uncharacterized protein LTR77_008124 [Saxophila tyrrhenica]|uniref:SET domain-containing protein n=1 Tax=Saxophila tyrrhenica TaxID=1690608 RepID=A0AAV9P5Q3_9PEZI|nr:hypothetical protein LTR77_008124 [Saxophila tyrrhenica]
MSSNSSTTWETENGRGRAEQRVSIDATGSNRAQSRPSSTSSQSSSHNLEGSPDTAAGRSWEIKASPIVAAGNVHDWDQRQDLFLRARRDIPAGAEILVPYVREMQPYDMRKEQICSYGFVCTCAACVPGTEYFNESEFRRIELDGLWKIVTKLHSNGAPELSSTPIKEQIRLMERMVQLCDQEPAMQLYKAQVRFMLGFRYGEEGDAEKAQPNLEEAVRLLTITGGEDDDMTKECKSDLRDLKRGLLRSRALEDRRVDALQAQRKG